MKLQIYYLKIVVRINLCYEQRIREKIKDGLNVVFNKILKNDKEKDEEKI